MKSIALVSVLALTAELPACCGAPSPCCSGGSYATEAPLAAAPVAPSAGVLEAPAPASPPSLAGASRPSDRPEALHARWMDAVTSKDPVKVLALLDRESLSRIRKEIGVWRSQPLADAAFRELTGSKDNPTNLDLDEVVRRLVAAELGADRIPAPGPVCFAQAGADTERGFVGHECSREDSARLPVHREDGLWKIVAPNPRFDRANRPHLGFGGRDPLAETGGPEAGSNASKAFRPTHRVVRKESFYRDGPQQARPPDGSLSIGDEVQHLADAGSYVRIRLRDGTEASVPVGSIAPIQ